MKRFIVILICTALLLTGCCPRRRPTLKDVLLGAYEGGVSFIGKFGLTPSPLLIGERDRDDDYTGTYRADISDKSGKDVIFGGISTKKRTVVVKADISALSGSAKIKLSNGGNTREIYNGETEIEITAESYLWVEYDGFTGSVSVEAKYRDDASPLNDAILEVFEGAVSLIGKIGLTSSTNLIGERDRDDDYTGTYRADISDKSGKDVIFGGISMKKRTIVITADISALSGSAKIKLSNGGGTREIHDGETEIEIIAESYLWVEYDGFTGRVMVEAKYRDEPSPL